MKIDKYYHLYSRKLDVVFEEIPNPVRHGRKARIIDAIDEQPTIEVEPVRRGTWNENKSRSFVCSECGMEALYWPTNIGVLQCMSIYCPRCGAKMEV